MPGIKLLLLDNYDSFTFNLLHLVEQFEGIEVDVIRNDRINVEDVNKYDRILLSPGPGLPEEAGRMKEIIHLFTGKKPILGICLGHQAIAESFGGRLVNLDEVQHGVSTRTYIKDPEETLFKNFPKEFMTGRYHSWTVDKNHLPDCLKVTAVDEKGNTMALKHREYNVKGVQFHPESILTEFGKKLLFNWLRN